MNRHGERWTPEEDDRLRAMAGKLTIEEAAQALGRTPKAVSSRAHKCLGIVWRECREYWALEDLMRALRVSRRKLMPLCERLGIQPLIYGKGYRAFSEQQYQRLYDHLEAERGGDIGRMVSLARRKVRPDFYILTCVRCGGWAIKSVGYRLHMSKRSRPTCARCRRHGEITRALIGSARRARIAVARIDHLASGARD